MRIDVTELWRQETGATKSYRLEGESVGADDLELTKPLDGEITLLRWDEGLQAKGQVSSAIQSQCHRCLEDFELAITTSLQGEFVEQPKDDQFGLGHEGRRLFIELDPLIRQELLLQVPVQTVCKEGCLGLCAECGEVQQTIHEHASQA